jgi:hypothetical protein
MMVKQEDEIPLVWQRMAQAEFDTKRYCFALQSMTPACAIARLLTIGSWKKNE